MADYRILVTGSRDWADAPRLAWHLGLASGEAPSPGDLVIVHGDCPTGADRIADLLARDHGIRVEPHPADWCPGGVFDRAAGFKRNAAMVALGANLCVAFIRNESHGATHCADLAEKAGIPVRRYTDNTPA